MEGIWIGEGGRRTRRRYLMHFVCLYIESMTRGLLWGFEKRQARRCLRQRKRRWGKLKEGKLKKGRLVVISRGSRSSREQ